MKHDGMDAPDGTASDDGATHEGADGPLLWCNVPNAPYHVPPARPAVARTDHSMHEHVQTALSVEPRTLAPRASLDARF